MICNTIRLKNRLKTEINSQIEVVDSLKRSNENLTLNIDSLLTVSTDLERKTDSLRKAKNKPIYKFIETIKYETDNDTIQALIAINEVNNELINNYEQLLPVKDSIIAKQAVIIVNDKEIQNQLELEIANKDKIIQDYNSRLIKEKNKKIFFEITTATAAAAAVTILLL